MGKFLEVCLWWIVLSVGMAVMSLVEVVKFLKGGRTHG